MTQTVPFVALDRQYNEMRDEINNSVQRVMERGLYVLGPEVGEFETSLAEICGSPYCLTVANGTDALVIALKVLGIGSGDEVIVPTNSFIASAGAVVQTGAKPVFCDVLEDFNIDASDAEKRITANTKAIMPVHLTGRPADMIAINSIAQKYDLFVIEDAAQAIGASLNGEKVGSMGDLAAFSLHPLKNLFVMGDGGFISMKCPFIYEKIKKIRNHGLIDRDTCAFWGMNSRLDTIHCAIGLEKIKVFDSITNRFKKVARMYKEGLMEVVNVPDEPAGMSAVYHNFVITCERRDELSQYLSVNGIETKMHYPILLHRQPAAIGLFDGKGDFPMAEKLNAMQLSLPIFPEITEKEVKYVIENIISFYKNS
jgi:dTDP-4-amino-4,6-dideoxygalactose transaminase